MEAIGRALIAAYDWCRDLIFTGIEWGANKITAMIILYYAIAIALIFLAGGAVKKLWDIWQRRRAQRRRGGQGAENGDKD